MNEWFLSELLCNISGEANLHERYRFERACIFVCDIKRNVREQIVIMLTA